MALGILPLIKIPLLFASITNPLQVFNKNSLVFRDEGFLRGTTLVANWPPQCAVTGYPGMAKFSPYQPGCINQMASWALRAPLAHAPDFTFCYRLSGGWLITPSRLYLMDPEGFEPSTSSMPLKRAPNCAMGPWFPCGPGGIRTLDLVSAIDARSHLRYRPINWAGKFYTGAATTSRTCNRL